MVNIIENKALIEAEVIGIDHVSKPKGYIRLTARLLKSSDMEGYPNLAQADEGSIIHINVRPDQFKDYKLKSGSRFSATVKKSLAQQYYMEEKE